MSNSFEQPGVYAIHIAGELDDFMLDCLGGFNIRVESDEGMVGRKQTVVTGWVPDQAALIGILDALYNAHYTLLHLRCLECGWPIQEE